MRFDISRGLGAGLGLMFVLAACEAPGPDVIPPTTVPGDLPAPAAQLAGAEDRPLVGTILPESLEVEGVTFSRNGETVYLAAATEEGGTPRIMRAEWDDESEAFGDPVAVHFSTGEFPDNDPFLVPDGSYLLFTSMRPSAQPGTGEGNVWVAQWQGNDAGLADWSEPWALPLVNSGSWDGAPSLASSGNLYFSTRREGLDRGRELYRSELEDGAWLAPEPLGEPLASLADDIDPWIAPDESFLLFSSDRGGAFDLYVAFRSEVGGWFEPLPLGDAVNTEADETAPTLSATGEFLFFHREGEGVRFISVEESGISNVLAQARESY